MPYELRIDTDLTSELRRVAGEQAARGIESADRVLQRDDVEADPDTKDEWDEAVHDIRKRCKKVRAVARLCRDELDDAYTPINVAFRDTARLLSDARDAWKVVETVREIIDDDPDAMPGAGRVEPVEQAVAEQSLRVHERVRAQGALREARARLVDAAAGIDDWPLSEDLRPDDLFPSLKRVYKRGSKGWDDVKKTVGEEPAASTADWHEWRKRVKYLWYHMRLLAPAWEEPLEALADELDDLADLVGEDHDLAVLLETLHADDIADPGTREQFAGVAARRRHALREQAAVLASKIYVEKPKRFASRIVATVEAARDWRTARAA